MTRREELERHVAQLRDNAHRCGKQGPGTHRNVGNSGRVADLYFEAKRELDALIAQEGRHDAAVEISRLAEEIDAPMTPVAQRGMHE